MSSAVLNAQNTRLDLARLHQQLPSHEAFLALLAFAQEGDIVTAARSLSLSQPALSFHLKKLEEQVGFPLFAFSGKRKVLTQLGKAYVAEVKSLLSGFQKVEERIARSALALESQTLRIAGRRELLIPLLPFSFPGVVEFIQTSSLEALRSLKEHRVDLAVSAQTVGTSDLIAKLFFESGFQLITPRSWKEEERNEPKLFEKPVVSYGSQSAYLKNFLLVKNKKLSDVQISRVVEDWFSVVELVRNGAGWAIIPQSWEVQAPEVRATLIQHPRVQSQKVFFFYRKEDRRSAWVKSLEEWLKARQTEESDSSRK